MYFAPLQIFFLFFFFLILLSHLKAPEHWEEYQSSDKVLFRESINIMDINEIFKALLPRALNVFYFPLVHVGYWKGIKGL